MKPALATMLAFAASMVATGMAFALWFILDLAPTSRSLPIIADISVLGIGISVVSLVPILLFAVPAYLIGKKLDLIRWWSALIIGLGIGGIVSIVFQWPLLVDPSSVVPRLLVLEGIITYAAIGGLSGFIFWLVWSRGRRHAV